MPQFSVYINGERCELLDDRRFCMYPKFPEGTELFDPTTIPPRPIPLSQDAEDLGVTARKLIPQQHYIARIPGDPAPAGLPVRFLIVHNVPANVTARDLGQFFEQYSQVIEADILRWPGSGTLPKGRGYVALQNQEAMQMLVKERMIYFDPMEMWLFIEPSDRNPAQPPPYHGGNVHTHGSFHHAPPPPPPQYDHPGPTHSHGHHHGMDGIHVKTHVGHRNNSIEAAGAPVIGHHGSSSSGPSNRRSGPSHDVDSSQGASSSGTSRSPPHYEHRRGPTGNSELANFYYFVDRLRDEDVALSVKNSVFWPSTPNRREYVAAAQRGHVYIIFLVTSSNRGTDPFLYGYSRLVWPQQDRGSEMVIQWVTHGVQLEKRQLQERLSVNVVGMSEGTPVKPELGQSIAEYIEVAPRTARLPAITKSTPSQRPAEPVGLTAAGLERRDREHTNGNRNGGVNHETGTNTSSNNGSTAPSKKPRPKPQQQSRAAPAGVSVQPQAKEVDFPPLPGLA